MPDFPAHGSFEWNFSRLFWLLCEKCTCSSIWKCRRLCYQLQIHTLISNCVLWRLRRQKSVSIRNIFLAGKPSFHSLECFVFKNERQNVAICLFIFDLATGPCNIREFSPFKHSCVVWDRILSFVGGILTSPIFNSYTLWVYREICISWGWGVNLGFSCNPGHLV